MSTTLSLIPLLEPIRPDMEQVRRLVDEKLAQAEEPLRSMLHRSLDGGKQLRSALVILVGQLLASSITSVCHLAAAVEMLHTATLIHDDVVDQATLRRGQETLHTIWPAAATVLAGDYLLGESISLIAGLERPGILKVYAAILCTMCAGVIRQAVISDVRHEGREAYYRSIEAKTASLFAAATEMAGMLAGADEPQVTALRRFGREFGLAFQIADDVLDLIGDESELGKPAGSDLRQGLVTLPILHYLEQAAPLGDDPVRAVLDGRRCEAHVRTAIAAIRDSGAIEAALEEARAHARRSQEALAILPDSDARRMLCELAGYVVERRR